MTRTFRITDFKVAAELLMRKVRVVGQTDWYVDFDDTNLNARMALLDIRVREAVDAVWVVNGRTKRIWN